MKVFGLIIPLIIRTSQCHSNFTMYTSLEKEHDLAQVVVVYLLNNRILAEEKETKLKELKTDILSCKEKKDKSKNVKVIISKIVNSSEKTLNNEMQNDDSSKKNTKNRIVEFFKYVDRYFEKLIFNVLYSISSDEEVDYEKYNDELKERMKEYLFLFEPPAMVMIGILFINQETSWLSIILLLISSMLIIYCIAKILKYDRLHKNLFTLQNILKEISRIKNVPSNIVLRINEMVKKLTFKWKRKNYIFFSASR
ncbi:hypothetical protein MKS88_002147 [Plasmodium brasilianum]|nr:hypothetical protein MKS88_002147 [Plasmodium brasilianum]